MAQEINTETPEQRERRLAKKRAAEAEARRRSTPEQRETHLAKKRWAAARAREKETPEQRQARHARRRAADAEARQKETPEHRQLRLAARRAADAKGRQNETPEQRQYRLALRRVADAEVRRKETPEQRQVRLVMRRTMDAKARQKETPEQRHFRLAKKRMACTGARQTQAGKQLSHLARPSETYSSPIHWMPSHSQSMETSRSRLQESASSTTQTETDKKRFESHDTLVTSEVKIEVDNAEEKPISWLAEQCLNTQGHTSDILLKQEKLDVCGVHNISHIITPQNQGAVVNQNFERVDKHSVRNNLEGDSSTSRGCSISEYLKEHGDYSTGDSVSDFSDFLSHVFIPGSQQGVMVKLESTEYIVDDSQHTFKFNTGVSKESQ